MNRVKAVAAHISALGIASTIACGCGPQTPKTAATEVEATFRVDPTVKPFSESIPGIDGGPDRRLGAIRGASGEIAELVLGELVIAGSDRAALDRLVARWSGQVLAQVVGGDGVTYALVHIDPSAADTARLRADLFSLDPAARGEHVLSGDDALKLTAVAAQEAAQKGSLKVGLNFVLRGQGLLERSATEAPTGSGSKPYNPNPMNWQHISRGAAQRFGVDAAWEALAKAGKLGNKVRILVMDGGFVQHQDLPAFAHIHPENGWRQMNPDNCGNVKDPCLWHGTEVASTLAAQVDNSFGGAGPAGPVAELVMAQSPSPDLFKVFDYINGALSGALGENPRIINISATVSIPGGVAFAAGPVEGLIATVHRAGILIFAAAGNQGRNVDADDCASNTPSAACWENAYYFPCEASHVICVGGLEYGLTTPDPGSNTGSRQRRDDNGLRDPSQEDYSVDLYGPYTVWGIKPAADGTVANQATLINGTSFASPFVAGIAALVWAANPSLTADQVFGILLETAHDEAYPIAPHRLLPDAYGAVRKVLGNTSPTVKPISPLPFDTKWAGTPVSFEAKAWDADDWSSCCTLTWTSNLEGTIGSGDSFSVPFDKIGWHTLTLTATDSEGSGTSVSFVLEVKSSPPTVSIDSPKSGDVLYKGLKYVVKGQARDGLALLPCKWSSDNSQEVFTVVAGCSSEVTFIANGSRTVTLSATNKYGQSSSTSVNVTVTDPPANFANVTITAPLDGAAFYGAYTQTLSGYAQYGDGTAVPGTSLRWSAKLGTVTTVLGTGKTIVHTFALGKYVITLEALNQASAVVGGKNVTVNFYSNLP